MTRQGWISAVLFCVPLGAASAQVPDWVTQLIAAADLPVLAVQLRNEGVPAIEVRQTIDAMVAARLRAHEARELLGHERDAIRDHGPVDNFGAFVQSKLSAGLRGRDLAAAIKAEHVARGKGKPQGARGNAGRGGPGGNAGRVDTTQRGTKAGAPGRPTPNEKAGTKGPPPSKGAGRPDRPSR